MYFVEILLGIFNHKYNIGRYFLSRQPFQPFHLDFVLPVYTLVQSIYTNPAYLGKAGGCPHWTRTLTLQPRLHAGGKLQSHLKIYRSCRASQPGDRRHPWIFFALGLCTGCTETHHGGVATREAREAAFYCVKHRLVG